MNQIDIKGLHFSYTEKEEILKGINLVIDERPTACLLYTSPSPRD